VLAQALAATEVALVGQDLIRAAEVRATVTQIEKYNAAANTFRVKYGYLPGDIPDPVASSFSFIARGIYPGQGDGNGIVDGNMGNAPNEYGNWAQNTGEAAVFWVDLSAAQLIDGGFSTAKSNVIPAADVTGTALDLYFPKAKLGRGNYIYIWTGDNTYKNQTNYYGLSMITDSQTGVDLGQLQTVPGLSALMAFQLDQKVDDGIPTTGRVVALTDNGGLLVWVNGQASDSATSCYNNVTSRYSTNFNNGSGVNYSLSFQFQ